MILNLNFDNVKIRSNNSTCEDSVNFIKTSGNVQEIDIRDSVPGTTSIKLEYKTAL